MVSNCNPCTLSYTTDTHSACQIKRCRTCEIWKWTRSGPIRVRCVRIWAIFQRACFQTDMMLIYPWRLHCQVAGGSVPATKAQDPQDPGTHLSGESNTHTAPKYTQKYTYIQPHDTITYPHSVLLVYSYTLGFWIYGFSHWGHVGEYWNWWEVNLLDKKRCIGLKDLLTVLV